MTKAAAAVISEIRKRQLQRRAGTAADCTWLKGVAPVLHELMTVSVTDGAKQLDTASMTIFTQDGSFKVCLNDRATHMQLWVAAGSLVEALEALEAKLGDPEADWRPQPNWQNGKAPKGKRAP